MIKVKKIGIIAEDESDYKSFRILICRITKNYSLKFNGLYPGGCNEIRRKALAYAENLKTKGCNVLIFIHDLDRNTLKNLKKEINDKLINNPIPEYLICIPIEEIEAWFLSDPEGIKKALKLRSFPRVSGLPEDISSPKEKLGDYVRKASSGKKDYINTTHNQMLAEKVSIEIMNEKCKSFKEFYDFIKKYKY